MSDSDLGRQAAQTLWRLGLGEAEIDDPLTSRFAQAALQEIEVLQQGTAGVLREVLEGAQMSAEQLNVESFHGLIEVVQNADDQHASEVRVAVRKSRQRYELLIAHNGDRVRLNHVLAMTLAFVSTKRDDPRAKGRFGIGLKTLGRLGDNLTVHCSPYDFTIEGTHVRAASAARSIPGFYSAEKSETLLELRLREGFDPVEFAAWFKSLGAESLIFLDSVRLLRFADIARKKTLVEHRLREVASETLTLPGLESPCRKTMLREPRTRRAWERYDVDRPMPARLRRRYKAREATTPLAVAVPKADQAGSQIFAGLPVGQAIGLPVHLNAQFDIDVARRGIQHEELNEWLFSRLADLAAAVALERLQSDPPGAWRAIPLHADAGGIEDPWLAERVRAFVEGAQRRVKSQFRLIVGGADLRLASLAYEAEPLEGLITQTEIEGLRAGLVLVPRSARDAAGRWRHVFAELGGTDVIDVREALNLLDWDDSDLGTREVRWFIKLARAAIEGDLGRVLWSQRSIVTNGGERIVPPMAEEEGELLLRSPRNDSLASRLGIAHVIDPAYLSRAPDAAVVRGWLEEHEMLRDDADPETTLRALASRGEDDVEPLVIDDDAIRLLRDAFASMDREAQEELGRSVGRAVLVDVQRWRARKRTTAKARPTEAYLPGSIEDRKDGWSNAAARTPELLWIHPRYKDVLRRPGRRQKGSGEPRALASRVFFGLLGAEVAPRLTEPSRLETRYGDPASPIDGGALTPTQRQVIGGFERHATHLKGDYLSPDLLSVLRDLQHERSLRTRRDRARFVLSTLEREWSRMYANRVSAKAVWSRGSWHTAGAVPTTWLAGARDESWLTSEAGEKKRPTELAVRTPATEAIFGDDRNSFAYELDEKDASSPAVRALGVETDPQVSEMVDQLAAIRDAGNRPDERALSLRYAAIAAACGRRDMNPGDMVGDLTVRQLRGRFGGQRSGAGLLYADGRWLRPSQAFLGAPIFGGRRAFVSEKSAAERLWHVLRISRPSVTDCIDVLEEIARDPLDTTDELVLVNTYLYLEAQVPEAGKRERERLRRLPFWTGTIWQRDRPIYALDDPEVARGLAGRLPVWQLPVAASSVVALIAAADVAVLPAESFEPVVHENGFAAGATYARQFAIAVEILRDWLTRHDPKLFEARSIPWEDLASVRIAVDPQLKLELRLGRQHASIAARAHLTREPLTVYTADADALGEDDAVGRVIASLFTSGDRDKLALAWSRAWMRAAAGERGQVTLAEDAADDQALESLFRQASKQKTLPRRKPQQPRTRGNTVDPSGGAALPVRRLKQLESFSEKTVELAASEDGEAGPAGRPRGLRKETPDGKTIGRPRAAPPGAPLAYSADDREELGLRVLQLAINGEAAELKDYRHLRGIGADALDKLARYFELKTSYGALPDEVTLTANEAEQALREGNKFFLAVVAGLEEGYETVVKVFANPLRNLSLKPNTSVTLAGITRKKAALEVTLADAAEPPAARE